MAADVRLERCPAAERGIENVDVEAVLLQIRREVEQPERRIRAHHGALMCVLVQEIRVC